MKIKLDENIGRRGVDVLKAAGHDVSTVREQNLQGAKDATIFDVCATEGRVLVTLDRDFGEVLRFPPDRTAGIIILDVSPRSTPEVLLDRLRDFLAVSKSSSVKGKLWIVEPGRVRVHMNRDEPE